MPIIIIILIPETRNDKTKQEYEQVKKKCSDHRKTISNNDNCPKITA